MRHINHWLGSKMALFLSSMGCFYIILALVIVPLFFQHPIGIVAWVMYVVQSIFQGVALPILGYVSRVSGEKQEQILRETHDVSVKELQFVREELKVARQERKALKMLVETLQGMKDYHFRSEADQVSENYSDFNLLFWSLIGLVDQGFSESLRETEEHIERRDVVEWIVSKYGDKEHILKQHFKGKKAEDLNNQIHEYGTIVASNPCEVSNNGLLLLLDIAAVRKDSK